MTENTKHIFLPLFISAFLSLFALPAASRAGIISIETTTTASVTGNKAGIAVSVLNKGDEAAGNVRITVAVQSGTFPGKPRETLSPGERYSEDFTPDLGLVKAGRYPVIVTVTYTDANLYPFSALSVSYLNFGGPVECDLAGTVPELRLSTTGAMEILVRNVGDKRKTVHYDLESPRELVIEKNKGEFTIEPRSEVLLDKRIKNLSALVGSKYRVYAIFAYEDGERHCSYSIPGDVHVIRESPLERYKGYLIGLVCVLAAVTALYNLGRYAKRARKG